MKVVPLISTGYDSNVYVLIGERVVVIDTGLSEESMRSRLRGVVEPEDVEVVINTHAHLDHCGGNSLFENAEVMLHELDAEAAKSGSFYGTASLFGAEGALKPGRLLREGDRIDLGGDVLEVVHTPGHTPGSICLYLRGRRALFTGDTLFAGGSFGRTDLQGGNMRQLAESVCRIAELGAEVLYPGHMETVRGEEARECAEVACQAARRLL